MAKTTKHPYETNPLVRFVCFHDRFMSDWGPAQGKRSIYVLECASDAEEQAVMANGKARSEMGFLCVVATRAEVERRFSKDLIDFANREIAGRWYEPGAFKRKPE